MKINRATMFLVLFLLLSLPFESLINSSSAQIKSEFGSPRYVFGAQGKPFIRAIPDGLIPKGQSEAFSTVVWNAGSEYPYCEVYMTVDNGEETELGRGHEGKTRITVRLGSTYDFKMVVYLGDSGEDVRDVVKLRVVGKIDEPGTRTLGKRKLPASGSQTGVGNRPFGDRRGNTSSSIASLPFFYDVSLQPHGDAFDLSFRTFEPSQFFIEVSREQPSAGLPTKTMTGQRLPPAFPGGSVLAAYTVPGFGGTNKEHRATIRSAPGQILYPDTLYHYVITAKAPDGSFHRYIGQFKNTSRQVRVIFERVKIISDGDPDPPFGTDCGEIDLWFWANHGRPEAKFFAFNNLTSAPGGRGSVGCSDRSYDINRELIIPNAPELLVLSVSGRDRDTDSSSGSDLFGPAQPAPFKGPRDTGDEEQNVADSEFNLRQLEINTTISFKLVSKNAKGGDDGDLMFEVYGRIIITATR